MGSKKTATLTERQWDHVMLALESYIYRGLKDMALNEKIDCPISGLARALNRFKEIHTDLVEQLDIAEPKTRRAVIYWDVEESDADAP